MKRLRKDFTGHGPATGLPITVADFLAGGSDDGVAADADDAALFPRRVKCQHGSTVVHMAAALQVWNRTRCRKLYVVRVGDDQPVTCKECLTAKPLNRLSRHALAIALTREAAGNPHLNP